MARGKRSNTITTSVDEEIQFQGVLSLLQSKNGGAVSDELQRQFFEWLRDEASPLFTQHIQQFAMFKVEQKREDSGDVNK